MADVFNKTPAEFVDINTMFDVLNNRVGFEAEQLRAIVENTYWLYNYALEYHIPADNAMSNTSTNAVQNKVIKAYVDNATSGLATNIESAAFTMQWQDFNTLQFKPLDGKKGASKTSADLNLIEVWFPDGVYTFTLNDTTARGRILALQQRLDQFDNWGYSFQEALSTLESRINTADLDIDNLETRTEALETELDKIDLTGYVTNDEFDSAKDMAVSVDITQNSLMIKPLNWDDNASTNSYTGDVKNIYLYRIKNGQQSRVQCGILDTIAREHITALDTRTTALETQIGDIGTLLDTINGEVI